MNDPPVTIDVIKQVKPGCESEFEQALTDLIAAAEGFDGHLGANVFRTDSEYRIVFKFDHLSSLQQWEASAIRRKLLDRAERYTVGAGKFQVLTGLETWFTLTPGQAVVPPLVAVQQVLPAMQANRKGTILLTGGGLALNPFADVSSLGIGKADIRSLAFSVFQRINNGSHA